MSRPDIDKDVLKGVSRSFYLSLRLLPKAMRRPAAFAYMLARISDTIADSPKVPSDARLAILDGFSARVSGDTGIFEVTSDFISGVVDPREKQLMSGAGVVLSAFEQLGAPEIELIREVVGIIISGQRLDIQRFRDACGRAPVSLKDNSELEDYAWRVAGCVGVFWTKLGYLTLGEGFSKYPQDKLMKYAGEYGISLQLVNILRDLPEDMDSGRCYLPVADPTDRKELSDSFSKWREEAVERVEAGLLYAEKLRSRRLRVASVLPAMIAKETLQMMEGADVSNLEKRMKVPRHRIYSMLLAAMYRSPKRVVKRS